MVSGGRTPMTGAKGFVIIVGSMIGILAVLWAIAALAAPH